MSWGIDEVDEKPIAVLFLSDECQVLVRQFVVQGDCTVWGGGGGGGGDEIPLVSHTSCQLCVTAMSFVNSQQPCLLLSAGS